MRKLGVAPMDDLCSIFHAVVMLVSDQSNKMVSSFRCATVAPNNRNTLIVQLAI